jgi:hypothetical protein
VRELVHEYSQRHAVLQAHRNRDRERNPSRPLMVLPSLLILMKISPGLPSSYRPT